MICPFASWLPVQNHGGQMAAHLGLVLHEQEGDGSLYGYFNNPASNVSSHFWVSKTGALEQYLDTNVVSWAQEAGNETYLSVETEGFQTEPLTSAQVFTVARLLAWSAQLYNFPIVGPVPHGEPGFTPHCNPNGSPDPAWGDHPCPGSLRLAQMPGVAYIAAISIHPPLPPLPPPPPADHYPEDNMIATPANVLIEGGHGWLPCPVPSSKVTNVTVDTTSPDVNHNYTNVPSFEGVSGQTGPNSPNGSLTFTGAVNGTFGVVVWSVD